ncbi:MAG: hypothetical protein M1133_11070 [Armatimonadetes bacterium]|nr:hypothetical protein [Armatimonadota bacterium]
MPRIDTYELSNGCSFSIAPGWGCNMFSWKVDGVEMMYYPPDHPEKAFKITGGGTPTLMPAVGRTWDQSSGEPVLGIYSIHGSDKIYYMPPHGILFLCKFSKIDESREPNRASVTYELTVPEEVRDRNYPFDLGFIQRFTLTPEYAEVEGTITNKGTGPAPCAFGYHPYFRISNPRREDIEARLPVSRQYFLTERTVLLNGESEPSDGVVTLPPTGESCKVYGEVNGRRMSLIDHRAGRAIHLDFDEKFEMLLVWAPDGADFLCLEPWTRGLGAFESLKEPDWVTGKYMPVLQPGETVRYGVRFLVEGVR